MWQQIYDPLHNIYLSALVAAIPILFFLLALILLKLKGYTAAFISLIIACLVATQLYGMPFYMMLNAALLGVLNGLWPIGWIVLTAVWLYKLSVDSGKFAIIRSSISSISFDQRIQILIIAFCFGAFLEGAAGFGVPIAICAALLVELGFKPIKAAMLCLVANAAAGAYGAIGIPVLVGAQQGNISLNSMAIMLILLIQISTLFVPALLILILDGWRGLRQTWPATLLSGLIFSVSQSATLFWLGPELSDIIPPILALIALAILMRYWQPSFIYREQEAGSTTPESWSLTEVVKAWAPFLLLIVLILIWSSPRFKSLCSLNGMLSATTFSFKMPFLHQDVLTLPPISTHAQTLDAIWQFNTLSAAGTAIFVSVLLSILISKNISWHQGLIQLKNSYLELWRPLMMICLIMALAYIANYAGASSTLGLALARSGSIFPFFAPMIGWLGVFITGSVVNNNTLFAHLQAVTAQQIGASQALLVASNTAGGVMGKLISPQSIAIAAAAVNHSGQESSILRATLKYSFGLLLYVCLWTWILSWIL